MGGECWCIFWRMTQLRLTIPRMMDDGPRLTCWWKISLSTAYCRRLKSGGDGHDGGDERWKEEMNAVAAWMISGFVLARFNDAWRVVRADRWVTLFCTHWHWNTCVNVSAACVQRRHLLVLSCLRWHSSDLVGRSWWRSFIFATFSVGLSRLKADSRPLHSIE